MFSRQTKKYCLRHIVEDFLDDSSYSIIIRTKKQYQNYYKPILKRISENPEEVYEEFGITVADRIDYFADDYNITISEALKKFKKYAQETLNNYEILLSMVDTLYDWKQQVYDSESSWNGTINF